MYAPTRLLGTPTSGERVEGAGNYFLLGLGNAQGFIFLPSGSAGKFLKKIWNLENLGGYYDNETTPTNYEELDIAYARLQRKYEQNNALLRENNKKLEQLERQEHQHIQVETEAARSELICTLTRRLNELQQELAPYDTKQLTALIKNEVDQNEQFFLNQQKIERRNQWLQTGLNISAYLVLIILAGGVVWMVFGG